MENIDLIVMTIVVSVCFIVFIVQSFKEFKVMEKKEYRYEKEKGFTRGNLFNIINKLFDENKIVTKNMLIERVMSDMEYDGIYFPEENQEEDICNYSGLPSVKSYEN